MKFGVNFFPTVGPDDKPADVYYDENLRLVALAEELGYEHVKTVEHYFFPYGGYSPDPVTFLAAAAARTSRIRLVTGAAIPAFTHPAQLASRLAMLDNLSKGRLDVGFGRAFLPDEFAAFGVSMDESRDRFDESVALIQRLWTEQDVVADGQFHRFGPVTTLPRPFQVPHPPIFVATAFSADSCASAGRNGRHLLLVPSIGRREHVQEMLEAYRKAWAGSGRQPGTEQVHMSYTAYVRPNRSDALDAGRRYEEQYLTRLQEAIRSWGRTSSSSYPGYDQLVERVRAVTFADQLADTKVLAGTPAEVRDQLATIAGWYGSDVTLSLQVNPGTMPYEEAAAGMRLFAEQVAPEPAGAPA